ncbi:MAG: hypothetical protein CML13_13150 [Puniceicoccaceae bacterium]|mgnify:CR=1 FL=1|nr:hypothetical protein [Puniceicoccaceae bacterium]|tara:strand:- start:1465 stop:4092 length:2628 start_codon:yes stop_codon:yes gene_type:complete
MFLRSLHQFFYLFLMTSIQMVAGASSAVIVTGMVGNEQADVKYAEMVVQARQALQARGIESDQIETLGGTSNKTADRETILKTIASLSAGLTETDEFWLILLGHSGLGRRDVPEFQIRGPRLSAVDLAEVLEAIRAKQVIFIGTARSGAYIPYLAHGNRDVLTATTEAGELNVPRFPEFFITALAEAPSDSLHQLAATAAQRLRSYLESVSLAQGEHARLYDAVRGEILAAPFGLEEAADLAAAASETESATPVPVSPQDIEIPLEFKEALFARVEADDASLALIESAQSKRNPDGFHALVLQRTVELTVNADHSSQERIRSRVYLIKPSSFDEWGNSRFAVNPPAVDTEVEGARIILPDGVSYVLNTEVFKANSFGTSTLFFPQALPGSVVELSYTISRQADYSLPEFYIEYPLQESIPVLQASLELKLPLNTSFHFYLKNLEGEAVERETEFSNVYHWSFEDIPAYEPLPYDPPARELMAWVGVSSLESWQAFSEWYLRISAGAFSGGPQVEAKAAEIMANYGSRMERLRAAYEFVNALRYVAIEFGIGGFRPRTPEQTITNRYGDCKDKANLLIALLKEMGIEAQFVLINRMSSTDPEFPGWQFNHAIAYVPAAEEQTEDLWLDSTDTTTPFGFVAPGNVGRQALVFDGSPSRFMEVTAGRSEQSAETYAWDLYQREDGIWAGELKVTWAGLPGYYARRRLMGASPQQLSYQASALLADDFSVKPLQALHVNDPSDFSRPMTLHAEFEAEADVESLPTFGDAWSRYFTAPERNRDLMLNDNQRVVLQQSVRLHYRAGEAPQWIGEDYRRELPGHLWSITYVREDENIWRRDAVYDVQIPRVMPSEYRIVRRELRQWIQRLRNAPLNQNLNTQ